MSEINNSPVSVPAGSFDYDDLKGGLGKATRGAKAKYDENVTAALKDASVSQHTGGYVGEPGFDIVEREHEQLGVKERLQVYVGDKPAEIVVEEDGETTTIPVDASTGTAKE